MSLLREYIRELLSEAALGIDGLINNDFYIKIHDGGHYVSFSLSDKDGNTTPAPEDQRRRLDHYGEISLYPPDDYHGNCSGAWMVGSSEAMKGWGPLLYDVAMEYATMHGGGLMPDREMVSGEAKRVWDYYLKNRSDVTVHQLDNQRNTLTPEPEDNCIQSSAGDMGIYSWTDSDEQIDDRSWVDSPLSKRYTAPPKTIQKLKSLGRLIT